jgi:hypothetical protein
MKKKLLLIVLALAILTSLTAGTLAVYTRTVTESEKIEAKRFTFNASGSIVGNYDAITLAPSEDMDYKFTIANVDSEGGAVAEVPLDYSITLNYKAAYDAMPGLSVKIYDGTTLVGTDTGGEIKFTVTSAANEVFNKTYNVVISWSGTGDNAGQTTAGAAKATFAQGLVLTVVASQKI